MDHPVGDVAAARALLDTGRMLLGITLRAVAAAPVPLTVQQHRVLVMIAADGPRRVGALATDLGVNQSNASRIVDRLVGQGLTHRVRDPKDARASLVGLTDEGDQVLRGIYEHRLAAVLDVVARMPTPPELLTSVLEELSAAADVPPGEASRDVHAVEQAGHPGLPGLVRG